MDSLSVGCQVIYTDEHFKDHHALVTAIWAASHEHLVQGSDEVKHTCVNLVYVSGDDTKDDPYGRQIERNTSVVHSSVQPAGGACWRFPSEPRPKMGVVSK